MNICGFFLEHALNFPVTARHVNQTDLLEPSFNHFSTACFGSILHDVVQTFSISISCEVFVIFGMPTQNKNNSHIRSAGQNNSLAYKRAKAQQLPKTSTHQLTNTSTHKLAKTQQPPNAATHQLTNTSTHQLTNSSTNKLAKAQQLPNAATHQLTNTSTNKLTTPSIHQLISSQNHNSTSLSTYKPTNSKP